MAASIGPNIGLNYGWPLGENFKSGMDANLIALDALLHLSVISMALTAPPGSPASGDRYIVGASATGAWAGKDDQIALYFAAAWYFYEPSAGWSAYNQADDTRYDFDGADWNVLSGGGGGGTGDVDGPASSVDGHVAMYDGTSGKLLKDSGLTLSGNNTGDQTSVTGNAGTATALQTSRTIGGVGFDGTANITQPYDVHGFYPGIPTASAIVSKKLFARSVSFADEFAGSYAKSSVAASASTVFDVKKNGSSVGSITFAASGSTGTFTTTGTTVSFAAGDLMEIVAPATPDTSISNVCIVLAGTRG